MSRHITVKPIILDQNKGEEDYCTISIRITYDRKSRLKSLGHRVMPKYFDKKTGQVLAPWQNHRMYNADIQHECAKVYKDLMILSNNDHFGIQTIEAYLAVGSSASMKRRFDQFVLEYITEQTLLSKKAPGTTRNYAKHLSKFQSFIGRQAIDMTEINTATLIKYETFLIKKKNSPNTIWDSVTRFFKKFIHLAEKRFKIEFNIHGYEWPKYKGGVKEYLTLDELDRIEAEIDNLNEPERITAHFFLVGCYAGIRFSDWCRFSIERMIDNDALKVRANKNNEPIYLSLTNRPRLKRIIEKINRENIEFSFTREYTNRLLKLLARSAKIHKNISTHTGRHTFATLHLEKGFSNEYIAEMLGVTLKMVQVYAKTTRQKLKNEDAIRGGL